MKPWSISTTVRNPERVRSFLSVLKKMEGDVWNKANQKKFQILLIQYKYYGAGEPQFYRGLLKEQIALMETPNPISFKEAKEILDKKNYVGGGDMRGRQSFNPLKKMGLAFLNEGNRITISDFGNYFLRDDYDLGEVFFRSFLKWQLPNPDADDYKAEQGYNIKPFVAILHLINEVNKICNSKNVKAKGISKLEFGLFGLTLYNYENIKQQAENIIKFRHLHDNLKDNEQKNKYVERYIKKNLTQIEGINNLETYTDNAIRYFRLTRYIHLRGNGGYIDLEPRRNVELNLILAMDNGAALKFKKENDYRTYLCDLHLPILPWENERNLKKIGEEIITDLLIYQKELNSKQIQYPELKLKKLSDLSYNELKKYIQELRDYRKNIQQIELRFMSQQITEIENYARDLKNIFQSTGSKPVELERLCTLALNSLNDAIRISPNYPVGDDNEPTYTAPANKADIECFYESFNAICEVTMLSNRQQWYSEGQPVMRHLRDFEVTHKKDTYCLFIAPNIHRDTINTYWNSVKYEYEGVKQKIIPMTINQFLVLLEVLIMKKKLGIQISHNEIKTLFDRIINITNEVQDSDKWLSEIPVVINDWKAKIQFK